MQRRDIQESENDEDFEIIEMRKLLRENLEVAKETRAYARSVHKWQQLARAWTFFYWTVFIVLAVLGYYYAFPYLKVARDEFNGALSQFSNFIGSTPAATE